MAKDKDIEKSLQEQLDKYPWGELFRDDTGGLMKGLLPWLNIIGIAIAILLIWKK